MTRRRDDFEVAEPVLKMSSTYAHSLLLGSKACLIARDQPIDRDTSANDE